MYEFNLGNWTAIDHWFPHGYGERELKELGFLLYERYYNRDVLECEYYFRYNEKTKRREYFAIFSTTALSESIYIPDFPSFFMFLKQVMDLGLNLHLEYLPDS